MKKAFILLFPQKEYLTLGQSNTQLFNDCIKQRYKDKGYDFFLVKFKGSDLGFITEKPNTVIEVNISFEESNIYSSKSWKYADFKNIAKQLKIKDYSNVVIGGFHCFDCVQKLATETYKFNKNTLIDTDLTELFWNVAKYQKNWDIKHFRPEQKLERALFNADIPSTILNKVFERYKNPILGISSNILNQIKDKMISSQEEDSSTPIQ